MRDRMTVEVATMLGGAGGDTAGAPDDDRHAHCVEAAMELLRSEKSFISKMRMLDGEFDRRLRGQYAIRSDEFPEWDATVDGLFSHAARFEKVHGRLYRTLKDATRRSAMIVECGKTFREFIGEATPLYAEYATMYAQMSHCLWRHRKDFPRFHEFILVGEACAKESIASLRISPIQRVPRYKLLLNELVRDLEPGSIQLASVKEAIEKDEFFDGQVNLISPDRELIKTGEMTKLFSNQSRHVSRGKRRRFVLLTDCLIYAKVDGIHKIKHILPLYQMKVVDVPDGNEASAFQLVSPVKTITLAADTPENKEEWMDAIQSAVDAIGATSPGVELQDFESSLLQPPAVRSERSRSLTFSRKKSASVTRRPSFQFSDSAAYRNPSLQSCFGTFSEEMLSSLASSISDATEETSRLSSSMSTDEPH
ncbi:unnamed protein product (mitochondrion) [Plasmodiophora brassicae]|uniref:DH domain-containing protein n=1 Tax=Plasmodiophora brassicae TaxID=37360 RepID=A0A3P3Y864_PLABS|nr:unnamed protein product [Plasmodiophora brassicae]